MSAATTGVVATLRGRLRTTVGRELLAGVTGLALVGFILMHLAGNLLIYAGPEAINGYSKALHSLGELLWVARIGLIAAFVVHISAAVSLARASRSARAEGYESAVRSGPKTVASRLMLLSGLTLLFFLFFHLSDFTLAEPTAENASVNGENLGLYGLVWNSFSNPIRVLFYLAAMACLGSHLTHALSSVWVTLGILRDKNTPNADLVARAVGLLVAVGFGSIPIYVFIKANFIGGQV